MMKEKVCNKTWTGKNFFPEYPRFTCGALVKCGEKVSQESRAFYEEELIKESVSDCVALGGPGLTGSTGEGATQPSHCHEAG